MRVWLVHCVYAVWLRIPENLVVVLSLFVRKMVLFLAKSLSQAKFLILLSCNKLPTSILLIWYVLHVMLKENHVRVAGSVSAAIARARQLHPALPLIVEVETIAQLHEALDAGCDRILIDNFTANDRREAVRLAAGAPFDGRIPLEVSGSVDLDSVGAVAADGVDFISIGALTKHVRAIDLSMKLGPCPA